MTTVTEELDVDIAQTIRPGLFQVWINLSFGTEPPDWWWNSAPQALRNALEEAAECRAKGWITRVIPSDMNPQSDKRWDNP